MEKIHSIYVCTNIINGKLYIGYDSNWPNRKKRHEKDAFNKNSINFNDVFHKALRKYGKENFKWEVIYQSKDGNHCLNVMESKFINEYKSYIYFDENQGYNMTLGGDGVLGLKKTKLSKEKHSIKSSKEYKFWFDEKIISVKNLKKYCTENKLNYNCFLRLYSKKYKSFKYRNYYIYDGEKNFDEVLFKYNEKRNQSLLTMGEKHSKEYKFLSPKGELISFKNLAKFSRENNLNPQSMKQVAMRKIPSNKGWKLA